VDERAHRIRPDDAQQPSEGMCRSISSPKLLRVLQEDEIERLGGH
jgi:hypothetical protein